MQWVCMRVNCKCTTFTKAADVTTFMTDVIARLPTTPPAKCP